MRHSFFEDPVRRRLTPLLGAYFFGGIAFWAPVEKLFLSEIGFTPQAIGVMAAAYAATVPLLEIPSGVLADRWSRKGVLAIGHAGALLSALLGALSTNVPTYFASALLLGVYFAMQSGTFEAVVYDTVLEETGTSDRFESVVGQVRIAESVSLVLSALAGGLLAAVTSTRVTFVATLPFLVASLACVVRFREPRLHETTETRSLRDQAVATIDALRCQPRLVPVAAVMVLASLLTQLVIEFGPLWLIDADASAGTFGPAWAALMAALGLGGALATSVRFDSPRTAVAIGVVVAGASVCLLTLRHPVPVTAAQVALVAITVAVGVYLSKLLHDSIDSDVRAGVASGVGTATWLTFLPFAIGFGAISDRLGLHAAGWLVTGLSVALACLLGYVVVMLPRHQTTSTEVVPPAHEVPVAMPRGAAVVPASDAAVVDDVVEPMGVHRLLD